MFKVKIKHTKNILKLQWKNKAEPPTYATSKLGKGVEQKNDFVLERIDKTEKQGIINPNLRVARER